MTVISAANIFGRSYGNYLSRDDCWRKLVWELTVPFVVDLLNILIPYQYTHDGVYSWISMGNLSMEMTFFVIDFANYANHFLTAHFLKTSNEEY